MVFSGKLTRSSYSTNRNSPLLFALALTLLNFIGQLFSLLSESNSQLGFVASVPEEFTIYLNTFSIDLYFIKI